MVPRVASVAIRASASAWAPLFRGVAGLELAPDLSDTNGLMKLHFKSSSSRLSHLGHTPGSNRLKKKRTHVIMRRLASDLNKRLW